MKNIKWSTTFKATSETQKIKIMINGKSVGVRYLRGPLGLQLSAHSLIGCDLGLALSRLNHIEKIKDDEIRVALYDSAVVAYAKCFLGSKGRGVSLKVDFVKKHCKHLISTHLKIMDRRHQFIAHGGDNLGYEQTVAVIFLNSSKKDPFYHGVGSAPLQQVGLDQEDLVKFQDLASQLHHAVNRKIEELSNTINNFVREIPLNDLYEHANEIQVNKQLIISKLES